MTAHREALGSPPDSSRVVLQLLLAADLLCISLYVWSHLSSSWLAHLHLGDDIGWSQFLLHVKQLWLILLLVAAWQARRSGVVLAWLAVAMFFAIDDALQIHEGVGHAMARTGSSVPVVGMLGNHAFEVVWLAAWAVVLGVPIVLTHRRAGPDSRAFSRRMAMLFGLLALAGVLVDAVHVLVEDIRLVNGLFVIMEEGGEQVAMSLLVAMVFAAVLHAGTLNARRGAHSG